LETLREKIMELKEGLNMERDRKGDKYDESKTAEPKGTKSR
jgi:hypothetical protein